jgi:branched-chain amino acid aminotransferase
MALDNERVAWFNGKIVPESQVMIPFRDSSFLRGDGVFDMTRTFDGRIFRLEEHVARLYRSLKYVGIDCGVAQEQMLDISREVVERNRHLLAPNEDYWLGQRISRGVKQVAGDHWDHYGPNVIVECIPLPFAERAKQFVEGIEVITPSVRRTPPEALSPRAKMHQYLNMILAEQEVRAQNPDAWAVLLDMHGNLSEGQGCNIFLVTDGKLATPRERFVLPGISRQAVIDLANELGIACEEKDIDLYDAYTADE